MASFAKDAPRNVNAGLPLVIEQCRANGTVFGVVELAHTLPPQTRQLVTLTT
jgi:hypothetical protein